MTCMVDGQQLGFMENGDIYAMFGNALDNAISAVMELDDPDKRVITIKMVMQDRVLMIQVQNYFDHPLQFRDGLPKSTQTDSQTHGYGMKSMRYTAEKYNGALNIKTENGIFDLKILLPIAFSEKPSASCGE
jgi:sensor histidine kinase regulating citrate/malate metabolism